MLPPRNSVLLEVRHINFARVDVCFDDHPTNVSPEEATRRVVWVEVGVRVAMMCAVTDQSLSITRTIQTRRMRTFAPTSIPTLELHLFRREEGSTATLCWLCTICATIADGTLSRTMRRLLLLSRNRRTSGNSCIVRVVSIAVRKSASKTHPASRICSTQPRRPLSMSEE